MSQTVKGIAEKTLKIAGSKDTACMLAKRFFAELREYAQDLPRSLQEKERKDTIMGLHKLVGACAYFGAAELHGVLLQAENVVKKEDLAMVDVQLNRVINMLKDTAALEQEVLDFFKE